MVPRLLQRKLNSAFMNYSDKKKLAIVGLGYVGLPLAVEFGKIRYTLGFDINQRRIEQLVSHKDSTNELSPETLRAAKFLSFTSDMHLLSDIQIYIVAVPTPVDESNLPNLDLLIKASQIVGRYLKPGDIVIYESTVYPGATEEVCVPILENCSGLKYAHSNSPDNFIDENIFYCGYSPERINPGDKKYTITSIIKVTSGSTPEIATEVDALYSEIITAGTYKVRSIKIAEAAKVIENTQRDLNIAFVNELAIIFSKLNIDTLEVLEAASTKWNFLNFRPGLVGGHCIGVDPYYLAYKSKLSGHIPEVILAGRKVNDGMTHFIANKILKKINISHGSLQGVVVHILGITFKENCPDIRNSKVIDLVHELQDWGVRVVVSDPVANPEDVWIEYGITIKSDCFDGDIPRCDFLVVAVAHKEYVLLDGGALIQLCLQHRPAQIFDIKSIYKKAILEDLGFEVMRL